MPARYESAEDQNTCQGHQGVPESKYETNARGCPGRKVELPGGPDDSYVCIKAKASNSFMPKKTLARESHGKVEYIVTHRQRCESGDYGRGARSAGTRQESIHWLR